MNPRLRNGGPGDPERKSLCMSLKETTGLVSGQVSGFAVW